MKKSVNITRFYKDNKTVSKFQGVLFMIFGMIVLCFIIYVLFMFYNTSLKGAFESYNYGVDCSEYGSLGASTDNFLNQLKSDKEDYLQVKGKYYNTAYIEQRVSAFEAWEDKVNTALIDPYNNLVSLYNENPSFYDSCYHNISISNEMNSMSNYIDSERAEIDREFENNLRPLAESEGYVFYSS